METTSPAATTPRSKGHRWRRRIVVLLVVLFFGYLFFTEVLDPWGDSEYMEISHGDHVHFMPKSVDLDEVNVSAFPTSPPGPNETILPDGRVVPKQ